MTIIVDQQTSVVTVTDTDEQVASSVEVRVDVVSEGQAGPPGRDGGTYTTSFVQSTPAERIEVNHGLNSFPSVTFVDSSGNVLEMDVLYVPLTAEQKRKRQLATSLRLNKFQVTAALLRFGYLEQVEAYMASPDADPMVKIAYSQAPVFSRYDYRIAFMAEHVMKLPAETRDEILDNMFIFGGTVE